MQPGFGEHRLRADFAYRIVGKSVGMRSSLVYLLAFARHWPRVSHVISISLSTGLITAVLFVIILITMLVLIAAICRLSCHDAERLIADPWEQKMKSFAAVMPGPA